MVFDHIRNAALVHVRGGVRLVTNDQRLLLSVEEFPARAAALEHVVTKVSKHQKALERLCASPPAAVLRWQELKGVLEHLGDK